MEAARALRERVSKLRDALSPAERAAKSESIWKRLLELPEFQAAEQALFYCSFKSEVDTSLMRELSRQLGMAVAVPRAEHGERHMAFYRLADESQLESGPYGILQPPADKAQAADLHAASIVIVPGLVFDARGNRLGWGGGYYDRFLAAEGRGLPAVALAFDCQLVEEISPEAHDIPVPCIVTESRIIRS